MSGDQCAQSRESRRLPAADPTDAQRRRAPLIQTRPQQEFAATHERHEPLVATRERPARLVENVIGLEEYRHDIRVEQQQTH